MPKYFDIHSHLNSSKYDEDREEVIAKMKESGTHTVVVGTGLELSKKALSLAEKHDGIYATIGVHPVDDVTEIFNEKEFEKLVKHPKVIAIGECGLDFFHQDKANDYGRQKGLFIKQIEFALKHDKPLMIHSRDAYEEVLEILEQLGGSTSKLWGNVHFFAGDTSIAERFFALGFTISFTGVITFTHDYDEVVRQAPLDMIMSETDAPYVAPMPYRGKRNEPLYVSKVVERIAAIKEASEEHVRETLVKNAIRMLG